MTWLLDGSVLAALALAGHVHHSRAKAWFSSNEDRFATCAVTQGTLLRLHMTLAVDDTVAAAWAALGAIEAHPRHVFWNDGFSYGSVPHRHLQGAKQITDAWLAELARRRRAKLITIDAAFVTLHADVAVRLP